MDSCRLRRHRPLHRYRHCCQHRRWCHLLRSHRHQPYTRDPCTGCRHPTHRPCHRSLPGSSIFRLSGHRLQDRGTDRVLGRLHLLDSYRFRATQASTPLQALLSAQTLVSSATFPQTPAVHTGSVHGLPSSNTQTVPSVFAGFEHIPVAGSQTPGSWH